MNQHPQILPVVAGEQRSICHRLMTAAGQAPAGAKGVEPIGELDAKIDACIRALKDAKGHVRDELTARLKEAGTDVVVGDTRYYLGLKKTWKCHDPAAALEALLEHNGGDWKAVAECLSSNAIKPGASKGYLSEELHARHFEQRVEDDPKTGKPKKEPKAIPAEMKP